MAHIPITQKLLVLGIIGMDSRVPSNPSPQDRVERMKRRSMLVPKRQKYLNPLADHLHLTVDYGFFWWLSLPMFKLLEWIQSWAVNWGISIVLLTIVIKTLLFPLSEVSYRSMARMRKLTPQIKRIQEKYGTDRQKLGQEMMGLYRKEKANPLSGCFPMPHTDAGVFRTLLGVDRER